MTIAIIIHNLTPLREPNDGPIHRPFAGTVIEMMICPDPKDTSVDNVNIY